MMTKKILTTLAAVLCCAMTTALLTACTTDNDEKLTPAGNSKIVGKWYSDVSGMTEALWNYGKTWSLTEYKSDGTGTITTYYTDEDGDAVGVKNDTFNYVAYSNGTISMTWKGEQAKKTHWSVNGNELTITAEGEEGHTLKRLDAEMEAKFDKWSKTDKEDLIEVPQPARYTVFVYGNAGGNMDAIIEAGFWGRTAEFLKDHDNVRVVCLYKYGKDTNSQVSEDGDIVWFELTDSTEPEKIREEGMQIMGLGQKAKELKICDPNTLRMFMEWSSLQCPAEEYIFAVWGHGSGFNPMSDAPGKYEVGENNTRGVIYDEWNQNEELDMYEFKQAIQASGIKKLNTIFFHNCMMGNIETLTEVKDMADYLVASAHILTSDGILLTEFVRGLQETDNTEAAIEQMFEKAKSGEGYEYSWPDQYKNDADGFGLPNGDYKMIRTRDFDAILSATKRLATRLMELYPTQQDAIDRATTSVYRFYPTDVSDPNPDSFVNNPFFDLADYAHLVASETNDDELKTIAHDIDMAFDQAFVWYEDVNWNQQHLDHYTLSVCLYNDFYYSFDYKNKGANILCNIFEGYEQSTFHKLTGWGNWLRTNQKTPWGNPMSGGGEPL